MTLAVIRTLRFVLNVQNDHHKATVFSVRLLQTDVAKGPTFTDSSIDAD